MTVVDPRWVKPVDPALIELAREHRLVVSVEDNGRIGGCGAVLLQTLNDAGVTTPFRLHGIPQEFLDHAKRDVILERVGLDAQTIARGIVEDVTAVADGRAPGRRRSPGLTTPVRSQSSLPVALRPRSPARRPDRLLRRLRPGRRRPPPTSPRSAPQMRAGPATAGACPQGARQARPSWPPSPRRRACSSTGSGPTSPTWSSCRCTARRYAARRTPARPHGRRLRRRGRGAAPARRLRRRCPSCDPHRFHFTQRRDRATAC